MHVTLFSHASQVREIFSLLFGGETTVTESKVSIPQSDIATVAYYVNQSQQVRHLLIADLAFANAAGAALSLIPAGVVTQAIKRREVDQSITDNLREVMNICGNLFSDASQAAVRFDRLEVMPKSGEQFESAPRLAYDVQIARYPGGKIELLTLA
ncbi:hypothetical protein SH668x_002520 [Planctomicrobium sp. SH668]|uniref:hypothetical protein n=1 Tax=Planctomicrobium sp. SH668 TaxID=3448126 RepID=UPI003F5BF6C9